MGLNVYSEEPTVIVEETKEVEKEETIETNESDKSE
jgi:hypothetical protein